MYEISLSFKAPSRATGKFKPLPRYKKSEALEYFFAIFLIDFSALRTFASDLNPVLIADLSKYDFNLVFVIVFLDSANFKASKYNMVI